MKNKLIAVLLAIISLSSNAQSVMETRSENRMELLRTLTPIETSVSLAQKQLTLQYIPVQIPPGLAPDEKEQITSLWEQLQQACPRCSTGVTIGSGTVVGTSGHSSSQPSIWDKFNNKTCINTIILAEYKRKAKAYDDIQQSVGEQ